jgi:hypothetical protein
MPAAAEHEALRRAAMALEDSWCRLSVRYRTADVRGGLVLAQAFVNDLAQQVVLGPREVFHFRDQLGPHPVDAAQDQRRSEAAIARRRNIERHLRRRQRLQAAPQPFKFRMTDAGPGAASVNEPPIGIIIGEQQSSKMGPRSFGIGPADHEGKSEPQQFCGFHEPREVPSGLDNGLILDSPSRIFADVNQGVDGSKREACQYQQKGMQALDVKEFAEGGKTRKCSMLLAEGPINLA